MNDPPLETDSNLRSFRNYNFPADGFHSSTSVNNPCISSTVRGGVDWMRKLAFRYRRIKEIYNTYRTNTQSKLQLNEKKTSMRTRLLGFF